MNWFTGVLVYVIIWWVVLLTVLPQLGNLSQLAADINLPDFVKGFI